jgi:hypothetical protein
MSCFTSCKNIKIEDEQNAKICSNCMLQLKAEYTLRHLKLDRPVMKVEPDISENYPTDNNDSVKLEMKIDQTNVEAEKETNVPCKIVFLEPEIKHEPELIIEDEGKCLKKIIFDVLTFIISIFR